VSDTDSYFETVSVGQTSETEARTITEADIVNFAGVSGDFNHLHLDAERMGESGFGGRIAHGMLVLSVATGLLWQARTAEQREALVAFYGIDALRFRAPTFPGDTVHVETEAIEKTRRPDGEGTGVVRYAVEVIRADGTVVISCETVSLYE
jgi:acyl dehydratase